MTPTNRMTPEQANEWRRSMGAPVKAKRFGLDLGARKGKPQELIPTQILVNTETRCTLQIAVLVPSQRSGAGGMIGSRIEQALKSTQRGAIWGACCDLLGWDEEVRARLVGVTITRVSNLRLFEPDNLRTALKHVLDAWCSYAEHGSAVVTWTKEQTALIGRCDDNIIRTAETPWNRVRLRYAQEDCEWNSKLHGVRIHMTLLRRGQRWTPYTTHIAQRRRRSARKFRTASGLPTSDRS